MEVMVEKRRRLKDDAIALVVMMDLKEKEMGIRVFGASLCAKPD